MRARASGVFLALLFATAVFAEPLKPLAVGPIGVTVSDMDRSVAFFHDVLTFEKTADAEFHDDAFDRLEGVFGARVRVVDMRLGGETLRLTQYLTPQGRPIPLDSRSNDRWFQQIAIVVRDMDAAYARLRERKVPPVSTAPQTLPAWNQGAAGIRAFYFRDPDNHNLEIIYFPAGKGAARWQVKTDVHLPLDGRRAALVRDPTDTRFNSPNRNPSPGAAQLADRREAQQFAERPCLERAAARGVQRFGVGDFGNVSEAGGGEMLATWC